MILPYGLIGGLATAAAIGLLDPRLRKLAHRPLSSPGPAATAPDPLLAARRVR